MTVLVDTSVWGWRERSANVRATLDSLIEHDLVATCDAVKLELLYSTRNVDEFRQVRELLDALQDAPIGRSEWRRAIDVYEALAARGGSHHREVKHMDLLVAAAAESAGLPVLHCDADFERIAAVTGQPVRTALPADR